MHLVTMTPVRTDSMSWYPYSPALEKVFEYVDRFDVTGNLSVKTGNMLRVPRECVPLGSEDYRVLFGPTAINCKMPPKNSDQANAIMASAKYLLEGQNHVIEAPTGWGKSACINSRVLMFNGTFRLVQDVKVGDLLMGPDSQPRTVHALGTGFMESYEIHTRAGEVSGFNEEHIISLKCTGGSTYAVKGTIVNVMIKDYLKWSKYKKHCFKLWKPDHVDFIPSAKPLTIKPYVLGLLLGDGGLSVTMVNFTTADVRLVEELKKEATRWGDTVRYGVKCQYHVLGTHMAWHMGRLGLLPISCDKRFIPQRYKIASIEDRLQLIAGLIDTDGHLRKNAPVFDYISKSKQLAEDLVFLCRSVGLAAYVAECEKSCVYKGEKKTGTYFRVSISGDTDKIPTKLARKQARPRKQKKDVLMHGFDLVPIGVHQYFGFTLDKDHLYLTDQFFVTHNTYVGSAVAARVGQPTLICVPKSDLMKQWYDTLVNLIGVPPSDIGIIQAKKCDYKGKKFVLGMAQSLMIENRYPPEVYQAFGMLVFDECFHPSQEILTIDGWKPVAQVTREDLVAQVDQHDLSLSFSKPDAVIKKEFDGNLVHIYGGHCDVLATPGHDYFGLWNGEVPKKVKFEDFKPRSRLYTVYAPTEYAGTEPLSCIDRLALAYQADGTLLYSSKTKVEYTIRFAFRKERKILRMRSLLIECAIPFKETVNARGDTNFVYRTNVLPSKSLNWVGVPPNSLWARQALEEIVQWDGWRQGTIRHFESSLENAQSVQLIAVIAGCRSGIKSVRKFFRVSWSPFTTGVRDSKSLKKEEVAYAGLVYCLSMPKGTLVIRRNNKVMVSGNCHRMAADCFQRVCQMFPAYFRLGLSATPKRSDGRDNVIKGHIGPVLVKGTLIPMSPKVIVQQSGWSMPRKNVFDSDTGLWKEVVMPHAPGRMVTVVKIMAANKARNALICNFVKQAYGTTRTILVLSDLIDTHLKILFYELIGVGIKGEDIDYYIGGRSDVELKNAAHKRVILGTYKMVSEGTDYPHWDTLVLATPHAKVKQPVGRVIRDKPGKLTPVVYDLVDKDPIFQGFYKAREAQYYSLKANIIKT